VFGNLKDTNSRVSQLANDARQYHLLGKLGTEPAVFYLKKVDPGLTQAHEGPQAG
jgi:Fe-S-cluster-containing dehydrogenase component